MTVIPEDAANPPAALIAALLALDEVRPGERLAGVRFGKRSESIGGGFYWYLDLARTIHSGNDEQRDYYSRESAVHRVIDAWMTEFYDKEKADAD